MTCILFMLLIVFVSYFEYPPADSSYLQAWIITGNPISFNAAGDDYGGRHACDEPF